METIVKTQMEGIKFGEIQVHNHVAVIPLLDCCGHDLNSQNSGSCPQKVDYLTMSRAISCPPDSEE